MTEGTSLEQVVTALSIKIDNQARFTRSITVICTLAILGMQVYTIVEMFAAVPDTVVLSVMGKMETLSDEWNIIQQNKSNKAHAKKP